MCRRSQIPATRQDRQVFRLLQFDEEDAAADRMKHAGRHVIDVARNDRNLMQQAEQDVDILSFDEVCEIARSAMGDRNPRWTVPPSTMYQASALPCVRPRW